MNFPPQWNGAYANDKRLFNIKSFAAAASAALDWAGYSSKAMMKLLNMSIMSTIITAPLAPTDWAGSSEASWESADTSVECGRLSVVQPPTPLQKSWWHRHSVRPIVTFTQRWGRLPWSLNRSTDLMNLHLKLLENLPTLLLNAPEPDLCVASGGVFLQPRLYWYVAKQAHSYKIDHHHHHHHQFIQKHKQHNSKYWNVIYENNVFQGTERSRWH